MIDPAMAGKTSLGLSGLFFGKAVAGMTRVTLAVLSTDGMAATTPHFRVDHLRGEFENLREFVN